MAEGSEVATHESKVLIVDDDVVLLGVLQRALQDGAMQISIASSGSAALAELSTRRFDALVSDIQMPGMTGLKLLRDVREFDLDLPVVLTTGYPDVKTAATAIEYGAFQYLIKPLDLTRLRAVVERAIEYGRECRCRRDGPGFGSGSFYVGDRAGLEATFGRALLSLSLVYQPVVRAADSAVFGYEVLLRSRELLLPHPRAVLKAAEKLRRVYDVGRAVRDLVALEAEQGPELHSVLFVNLHPEDLSDPALYLPSGALTRIASRVVLELNDRAALEHVTDLPARVSRLRALGFRIGVGIGIDSAGESSPSRRATANFEHVEVDFAKIDLGLLRGIYDAAEKRGIIESLVQSCHARGRLVIAQGIENAAERDVVLEGACDFSQGYFFGRPRAL